MVEIRQSTDDASPSAPAGLGAVVERAAARVTDGVQLQLLLLATMWKSKLD